MVAIHAIFIGQVCISIVQGAMHFENLHDFFGDLPAKLFGKAFCQHVVLTRISVFEHLNQLVAVIGLGGDEFSKDTELVDEK